MVPAAAGVARPAPARAHHRREETSIGIRSSSRAFHRSDHDLCSLPFAYYFAPCSSRAFCIGLCVWLFSRGFFPLEVGWADGSLRFCAGVEGGAHVGDVDRRGFDRYFLTAGARRHKAAGAPVEFLERRPEKREIRER